jgi:PPOX class probable F420-dependent enzyme
MGKNVLIGKTLTPRLVQVEEYRAKEGTMALAEKQRQFLDENPFVGVVTTLRPDGSPHSTVVWVDVEDGRVSFNTARGRAKERYVINDPRVSLLVIDPKDAYRWVAVSGHAELTEEGADPQIDKLAKKYIGKDEYPWRSPDEKRVKVVIDPEKVDSAGFDA